MCSNPVVYDGSANEKAYRIIKLGELLTFLGANSGIVVKALRYKPPGHGFDSQWSLEFFIDIILPVALRPWGQLSL
jgi:hypothetical protein